MLPWFCLLSRDRPRLICFLIPPALVFSQVSRPDLPQVTQAEQAQLFQETYTPQKDDHSRLQTGGFSPPSMIISDMCILYRDCIIMCYLYLEPD